MTTDIVIVGAGGFGRECLDIIEAVNDVRPDTYRFLGFLDDGNPELSGRTGAEIIGPIRYLDELRASYVIGIGDPKARRAIDNSTKCEAEVLKHPAATIAADVSLGPGTVLTAGARLTNHIRVGRHVHVNLNATIGHDAILGDYVTLNPGTNVSGSVVLEEAVTMGTGSAIIQGCQVSKGSTVGAGAVVVKDIDSQQTVVGVPARPINQ